MMSRKHAPKILICTWLLSENRGGVAMVSRLIAAAFQARGYRVSILTTCPDRIWDLPGISVYAHPSLTQIWREWMSADAVILQGNPLRLAWPLFLLRKKVLLVRHIPEGSYGKVRTMLNRMLEANTRRCAVSSYMRSLEKSPEKTAVVPNPYDDRYFHLDPSVKRSKDLIYVGRFDAGKGVALLLDALELCHQKYGIIRHLTLVGDIHEAPELENRISQSEFLKENVIPIGVLPSCEVAGELNAHRCMVITSLWEAFGIVVLEGLACGCNIICAQSGGLPEALNGLGRLFARGNAEELAELLAQEPKQTPDRNAIQKHLENHCPNNVAGFYLNLLNLPERIC